MAKTETKCLQILPDAVKPTLRTNILDHFPI